MEKHSPTSKDKIKCKKKQRAKSKTKTTKVATNRSSFDPSRKTSGAIYLEAQEKGEKFVEVGDMTREMMTSLVDDLNETISSDPYEGRSFYITIYEKKDLQMPSAILRRLYTTLYRPYPEDDTIVFHVDPKTNNVKFCWCLPHHAEMDNMLINHTIYDMKMVADIKAWKRVDMKHFGFDKIYNVDGKEILSPSNKNRDIPLNFKEHIASFS